MTRYQTTYEFATGFFLTFAAGQYTLKETGLKYHLGRVPMERTNEFPQKGGSDEQLWMASQNGAGENARNIGSNSYFSAAVHIKLRALFASINSCSSIPVTL